MMLVTNNLCLHGRVAKKRKETVAAGACAFCLSLRALSVVADDASQLRVYGLVSLLQCTVHSTHCYVGRSRNQ